MPNHAEDNPDEAELTQQCPSTRKISTVPKHPDNTLETFLILPEHVDNTPQTTPTVPEHPGDFLEHDRACGRPMEHFNPTFQPASKDL